jgi:hypothetical protein
MSAIAHACETVGALRAALADIPDDCAFFHQGDDDGPVRVEIVFLERPSPENYRHVTIGPWPEDDEPSDEHR